jgi:hypothetical protein
MRPNDIHEGDGILVLVQNEPQTEGMRTPEPGALEVHVAHILTVTKATPSALEASTETNHEIITLNAATTDPTRKVVGTKAVTLAGLFTHGR